MSAEDIGNIELELYRIDWCIPKSIITDVHKKGLRLLSPKIDLDIFNSACVQKYFQNPNDFIALKIRIEPPDESFNRFVRLGMVNDRDEEICSCYDAGNGYAKYYGSRGCAFYVPRLLQFAKFRELFKERTDFYPRLFYEEVENVFKKANISIYLGKDTENIGYIENIYRHEHSIIVWNIPEHVLTGVHRRGLRALSPKIDFEFYNKLKHQRQKNFLEGIQLQIIIDPRQEPLNKFVRLGLVNDRDEEMCRFYDAWNPSKEVELDNERYFWIYCFITFTELRNIFEKRVGCYLRLYCEIMEIFFEKGHPSAGAGDVAVALPNAMRDNENEDKLSSVCCRRGDETENDLKNALPNAMTDNGNKDNLSSVCGRQGDEIENDLKNIDALPIAMTDNGNKDKLSSVCGRQGDEIENDLKRFDMFSQDFKHLLENNEDSDLTIKITEREFKVHKLILKARSPVFHAMLKHNLSENRDGVVNIEDCEPEVFDAFLIYLYSGKTENINSDNACGLYYLSDKYDLPHLKEECRRFLKNSFTLENICDIVCLSTKFNEAELLQLAINYFAKNIEEIMVTCNWLEFLKENPIEANELSLKAMKIRLHEKK